MALVRDVTHLRLVLDNVTVGSPWSTWFSVFWSWCRACKTQTVTLDLMSHKPSWRNGVLRS